jgi:hypothetical protein
MKESMSRPLTHTFVVKLWLESREIQGAEQEWRGRIDHIQSGSYLYFTDMTAIAQLIRGFMERKPHASPNDEGDDTARWGEDEHDGIASD